MKNDDEKMDMADGEMVNEKWMNELYTSPPHYCRIWKSIPWRVNLPGVACRNVITVGEPLKGLKVGPILDGPGTEVRR